MRLYDPKPLNWRGKFDDSFEEKWKKKIRGDHGLRAVICSGNEQLCITFKLTITLSKQKAKYWSVKFFLYRNIYCQHKLDWISVIGIIAFLNPRRKSRFILASSCWVFVILFFLSEWKCRHVRGELGICVVRVPCCCNFYLYQTTNESINSHWYESKSNCKQCVTTLTAICTISLAAGWRLRRSLLLLI